MGGRPAHLPRDHDGRLPEPVHDHRPAKPRRQEPDDPGCEQHVDWIADCLQHLRDHGLPRIEAEKDAEDAWVQHNNEVADGTLYPLANSWYVGANIPGKPRVFMPYVGGVTAYKKASSEKSVGDVRLR